MFSRLSKMVGGRPRRPRCDRAFGARADLRLGEQRLRDEWLRYEWSARDQSQCSDSRHPRLGEQRLRDEWLGHE